MSAPTPGVVELPGTPAAESRHRQHWLPREGRVWLLAAVLMILTGIVKGINLLILLSYLCLGLWFVNWRLSRRAVAQVACRRLVQGPVYAGEAAESSIELVNQGRKPVRCATVLDFGQDHVRHWMVLRIDPRSPVRFRHEQPMSRRGRYRYEPLRLVSRFPFGLAARAAAIAPAVECIVLPRLGILDLEQMKNWLARVARGDGRARRRRLHPSNLEADIHGLREYRTGDSPRWIHWPSSARRGQLLVREYEDNVPPELVLVVEPWLPHAATARDRNRLEALLSLAGTIVRDWCRDSGSRMWAVLVRKEPVVSGPCSGAAAALRVLETLAVEDGAASSSASLEWLEKLAMSARAPVLVLSSKRDSDIGDRIADFLGRPVAALDADESIPWYQLPLAGAKGVAR